MTTIRRPIIEITHVNHITIEAVADRTTITTATMMTTITIAAATKAEDAAGVDPVGAGVEVARIMTATTTTRRTSSRTTWTTFRRKMIR